MSETRKKEPKNSESDTNNEPSVPINEKIDELIAKIVPSKWLATSLVGATALFLLFFLMWAFTGKALDKEQQEIVDATKAKAKADINTARERADKSMKEARERADARVAKYKEDNDKLRTTTREATKKASNYERAKKDLDSYKAKYEKTYKDLGDIKDKLRSSVRGASKTESTLQSQIRSLEGELKSTKVSLDKTQKDYTAYKKKYSSKAKEAFDKIVETASRQTKNSQQLVVINKMAKSAEFAKELVGTDYYDRLNKHIKKVEDLVARDNKIAAKKSAQEAKARYNKAMADKRNANDDDARLEILHEAKVELEGSAYAANIQKFIDAIENKRRTVAAKAAYEEVTKKVAQTPTSFESNLEKLKTALPDVAKTSYESRLVKIIRSKESSLKNDIAKHTINQLNTFIRGTTRNPEGYNSVIDRCDELTPKVEGTTYNKQLIATRQKYATLLANKIATDALAQIDTLTRNIEKNKTGYKSVVALCDKLTPKVENTKYIKTLQAKRKQYSEYWVEAIGKEALGKAVKVYKDRNMANTDKLSALEELRREAEGSRSSRTIDSYIIKIKALIAREAK